MKEYMQNVTLPDAENAGRDTLCWDCKKAMTGGCSWTNPEKVQPVEGWVAKKSRDGYIVADCPQFERDTYCLGRYRTADDYILALETSRQKLKKQILVLKNRPAAYRKMITKQKKDIEERDRTIEKLWKRIFELSEENQSMKSSNEREGSDYE